MIWYLIKRLTWDEPLWYTKGSPTHWRNPCHAYTKKQDTDMVLGIVITEDLSILKYFKRKIIRACAA